MKKFTNQRGLAVLEVMIVAAIVAIFATAAVPKMARIIDKVQLDYEMKHLYSTMNLGRSMAKSSSYSYGIFGALSKDKVDDPRLYMSTSNRKYQLKFNEWNIIVQDHKLENGTGFSYAFSNGTYNFVKISDNSGDSGTITLTSKFGKKALVKIDSVGRVHGEYVK